MNPILRKGLLTSFFEGYNAATPQAEKIAMRVPSSARSEDYAWLGQLPRMRKMNGERIPNKLKDFGFTIVNDEYEDSIEVKRADLKDDQTGKYGPLVRSIGEAAKRYPDEVIFGTLIPNGFTSLCYDGQYFFDTDHPIGDTGSTQSNKVTVALDATGFKAARTLLRKLKDDYGTPVNQDLSLTLVVPVDLQGAAEDVIYKQYISGTESNPLYKAAEILVNPWLTDTNDWFLVNGTGTVKPFIIQEREFIPFEALEEGSEKAWWNKKFYYGTYWRGNFGYGLYQKAVGAAVT